MYLLYVVVSEPHSVRRGRSIVRTARVSSVIWLELRRLPQILSPCSFLLWILTHKRFHSNLAIAPTCDTVSTYHITDKARDPQRGLSRATYLLKSVAGRLWRAGRSAAGGGDAAASDLQIKGGGAR